MTQKEPERVPQPGPAQQKPVAHPEESKQNQAADSKHDGATEGRGELTPVRRNSEEANELSHFVPSPQDLIPRAVSAPAPTNPSNASGTIPEGDLPISEAVTTVTQPEEEQRVAAPTDNQTKLEADNDGEAQKQ